MKPAILLVLAVLAGACNNNSKMSDTSISEEVTKQVLDHHFQTFQQNDLDGVMADYSDQSILVTPDHTYSGLKEIRENFVAAFQALPTKGTTITMTKSTVIKDVAYIVWKATTPTLEFKYATDTFIIQNGKIISQTFAGDIALVAAVAPASK